MGERIKRSKAKGESWKKRIEENRWKMMVREKEGGRGKDDEEKDGGKKMVREKDDEEIKMEKKMVKEKDDEGKKWWKKKMMKK